jgi:chromosome segregation ATPase
LPSSSSPTKRKSDTLESRLIKRRRHRTSSSKSEPIIVEPEISALEAENARAAETQAEEDWVSELLRVDMSDYPESVMARLSGSDKSNRGIVSASDKFKSSPTTQGSISVESDTDLELRSLRATRDENEALKMKIKVLEMTLPTAESVKNELYAERKEKTQLIEALEIERSLLTQSEALRKQSDATREGLQQRIKQLEDRLNESAVTLERAREAAQVASEQRRKAEEATLLADLARTKLGVSLDSERDLVSRVREELAEEREIRAEVQAKLAATEARLAAEQRRYTEARDQAEKERAEAKSFLEAEKAIVSAQEAKLEREKEIRSGLETKLKEMEEKLKDEQAKQVEDKKKADAILQKELTMAMKLVTAEREVTRGERAKTATELEAKELAEKEIILLKEQLAATEKKLKEAQDGNNSMKRDLVTFKDQLSESTEQQHILRAHLSTAGTKLAISEGRTRAIEDRVMDAEEISRRHALELSRLQNELVSERHVLIMERQTLAKERISRRELEAKLVVAEERLRTGTKQTGELQAQLQTVISSGQGSTEQLQTQRSKSKLQAQVLGILTLSLALLHIARTRIQELEQAIQRVESDLDASRTAEAAAKTMVQLWGPPLTRTHLSSPVSDIVDRNSEQIETETDSFISLMKPPRQQSFKLKRTSTPARLLKLDMPSGEPTNIDLGGLPANPETIIDLLHRSKCAGVFWDIIMDEYGAMGCFDAAEAIAAGKLKSQL